MKYVKRHATDGRNVGGDPAPAQLAGVLNLDDMAKSKGAKP